MEKSSTQQNSITLFSQFNANEVFLKCMVMAFNRTNTEPFDITSTMKDVFSEFPKLTENDLKTALRNGGLGKYGKTYKLSTQEICVWIREYMKERKPGLAL